MHRFSLAYLKILIHYRPLCVKVQAILVKINFKMNANWIAALSRAIQFTQRRPDLRVGLIQIIFGSGRFEVGFWLLWVGFGNPFFQKHVRNIL